MITEIILPTGIKAYAVWLYERGLTKEANLKELIRINKSQNRHIIKKEFLIEFLIELYKDPNKYFLETLRIKETRTLEKLTNDRAYWVSKYLKEGVPKGQNYSFETAYLEKWKDFSLFEVLGKEYSNKKFNIKLTKIFLEHSKDPEKQKMIGRDFSSNEFHIVFLTLKKILDPEKKIQHNLFEEYSNDELNTAYKCSIERGLGSKDSYFKDYFNWLFHIQKCTLSEIGRYIAEEYHLPESSEKFVHIMRRLHGYCSERETVSSQTAYIKSSINSLKETQLNREEIFGILRSDFRTDLIDDVMLLELLILYFEMENSELNWSENMKVSWKSTDYTIDFFNGGIHNEESDYMFTDGSETFCSDYTDKSFIETATSYNPDIYENYSDNHSSRSWDSYSSSGYDGGSSDSGGYDGGSGGYDGGSSDSGGYDGGSSYD